MGQYDRKAQSQRKHGPILSSSTSKAPSRPPPATKPEWRGSGYTKKAKPKPHLDTPKAQPLAQTQLLPVELQQLMLNIFKDGFGEKLMDFEGIKGVLREINEAVAEGEWEMALEVEEKREAYAVRWSPSRALAYANVLASLCEQRPQDDWVSRISNTSSSNTTKVVCFGGNAAEVIAFAGLLRYLRPTASGRQQQDLDAVTPDSAPEPTAPLLDLTLVDSADWSSVLDKLVKATTAPPPLSKYASASARAANTALLSPATCSLTFAHHDIFSLRTPQLKDLLATDGKPVLCTFFLTLAPLYNISIPKTTALLHKLDALLPINSIVLVIDNINANTIVPISGSEETTEYSVSWLLSRVLLGKPQDPINTQGKGKKAVEEEEAKVPEQRWERVVNEEMKINRLDEKLRYPGSLENLKYQVLAYRRR